MIQRFFSFLLFGIFISASASAQFGLPTQLPKTTQAADIRNKVAQYCRLDYLGARINDQDWPKLKPVVTWNANQEFPLIDVVSRYEVDSSATNERGKWFVTVRYRVLGRFTMGQGYSTEIAGNTKEAQFEVAEANGELKVLDLEPNYPHPSRDSMLKWLQAKQAATDDPGMKVIYDHAIKELSAQSGSPFAK
jgi:hypothetical protein